MQNKQDKEGEDKDNEDKRGKSREKRVRTAGHIELQPEQRYGGLQQPLNP